MNSLGVSDRLRKGGEHQICFSLAYYLSFGQEFSEVTQIHIFIIMTTFQLMVGVVSFRFIHQFKSNILYRWASNFSEIMCGIDPAFHDQTGICMDRHRLGVFFPPFQSRGREIMKRPERTEIQKSEKRRQIENQDISGGNDPTFMVLIFMTQILSFLPF